MQVQPDVHDWPLEITDEMVQHFVDEFLKGIGDESLGHSICCICAGRIFKRNEIVEVNFEKFRKSAFLPLKRSIAPRDKKPNGFVWSGYDDDEEDGDVTLFNISDFYLEEAGVRMIYDPITEERTDVIFSCCSYCHPRIFGRKRLPAIAIANGNDFGPIPDELKDLTIVEQLLIQRVRPMMYVLHLKDGGGNLGYSCMQGNSIAFMQDQLKVNRKLPPPVESLNSTIQISLVGTKCPQNENQIKKILRVRRNKVKAAIEYLITVSHGFLPDSTIDDQVLTNLPDDGPLPALLSQVTYIQDPNLVRADLAAHAGYVDYNNDDEEAAANNQSDVDLLLQNYGVIDTNAVGVGEDQRNRHAIANLGKKDTNKNQEVLDALKKVINVTRSKDPINEYGNTQLWYDGFPVLFPHRIGAPEGEVRVTSISLRRWIQHVLNIKDDRFRAHIRFQFYVGNMLKRRDTCLHSRMKLKYNNKQYGQVAQVLRSLKYQDLTEALLKAEKGEVIREKDILTILDTLKSVGSKVTGSSYARLASRREILSLQLKYGLPRIFVTINPHDFNSPVLFFFNGIKKNVSDLFEPSLHYNRRRSIALGDPVSAAQFFHTTVSCFLDILLGYQAETKVGVLGKISAYYGTVETQGRGTLHFHCLVWLASFPSTEKLLEKLESDDFRFRVQSFIDTTCCASAKKKEDIDSSINVEQYIKPSDQSFSSDFYKDTVSKLALRNNMHKHTFTCYKYSKKSKNPSKKKCRFNFGADGKELCTETIVKSDGSFTLKRSHPFLNDYNEAIMYCIRSNMDIRFIPGSRDCRAVAMYVTEYITKHQLTTHNIIGIIASVFNKLSNDNVNADNDDACNLVLKCLNKINVCHEVSSPENAQYLLGFPDHYTSENFAPLFVGDLLHAMDAISKNQDDEDVEEELDVFMVDGNLNVANQRLDYIHRSESLEKVCFYNFVSYYAKRKKCDNPKGIPFPFLESHPQCNTFQIVRPNGYHVVPSLLKLPPVPNADRDDYERMLLLLFCPFRHVRDLLFGKETWKEALDFALKSKFIDNDMLKVLENLLDVHGAMEQREIDVLNREEESVDQQPRKNREFFDIEEVPVDEDFMDDIDQWLDAIIQQQEQASQDAKSKPAKDAWQIMERLISNNSNTGNVHVSTDSNDDYRSVDNLLGYSFSEGDVPMWEAAIQAQEFALENPNENSTPPSYSQVASFSSSSNSQINSPQVMSLSQTSLYSKKNNIIVQNNFNEKQELAFSLVADHLIQFLSTGTKPPSFRFLLLGEGGTGKSRVINGIRQFFEDVGKPSLLRVTATTGKAAALINGTTIHKLIAWTPSKKEGGAVKPVSEKLIKTWKHVQYLIIDEVSMLGLALLGQISKVIKEAKADTSSHSFGNINVILVGDFYQLDPVKGKSLTTDPKVKFQANTEYGINTACGIAIFNKEFVNVINLDQQMRQSGDQRYHELLKRLRRGKGSKDDYDYLMAKVIKDDSCVDVFKTRLITTTNAVKDYVNLKLVSLFAQRHHQSVVVFTAEDSFSKEAEKTKPVSSKTREKILKLDMKLTGNLPGRVELTVGMPVVITANLSVALGITNGSTGILREILFQPGHDRITGDTYHAKQLPLAVIVEIGSGNLFKHATVPKNCFPIFPITCKFRFQFNNPDTGIPKCCYVVRKQLPIIANFACTNYKCQGDTLKSAIIDLQTGPTTNSAAAAYVSFSRVQKGDDVHILRTFPIELLRRAVQNDKEVSMSRYLEREKKTIDHLKKKLGPIYITPKN
ncbi:MAG TPA: DUF6570 domain-containing protein [Lacibacter sp.]|nr:DUF6570 domain-containing protein [Lacibacter sp.]